MIQSAVALRDYYLKDQLLPRYGDVDAETIEYAIALKKMYFTYQGTGDPNRRIFLFNTAKSMMPYLSATESSAVWKKLE